MGTVNVSITFDSDLEYTWTYNAGTGDQPSPTSLAWSSGEGSPSAGSATAHWANKAAPGSSASWVATRSFEDWGVPAGATVTTVGNLHANTKTEGDAETGSLVRIGLIDHVGGVLYSHLRSVSDATAWGAQGSAATRDPNGYTASTQNLGVRLRASCGTPNGPANFADFYWDTVTFDIHYTSDVTVAANTDALVLTTYQASLENDVDVLANTDALTLATFQALIETGAATNVLANTDALTLATFQAGLILDVDVLATVDALTLATHQATVGTVVEVQATVDALTLAAYPAFIGVGDYRHIETVPANLVLTGQQAAVLFRFGTQIAAPEPTRDVYTCTVAGVLQPMIQFNVTRTAALEEATVYFPAAIEALVDVADALVITQDSYTAGNPTPVSTTLYTGTVASRDPEGAGLRAYGSKTPSYGTRVERIMDRISYQATSTATTLRGDIDSAFVPGDDVAFGTGPARFKVARVVFYATPTRAAMEVSSG